MDQRVQETYPNQFNADDEEEKHRLGTPLKRSAGCESLSSGDHEAYDGPDLLDGHPNFHVIRALTPGASGSVLLCLDRRDQVQLPLLNLHIVLMLGVMYKS